MKTSRHLLCLVVVSIVALLPVFLFHTTDFSQRNREGVPAPSRQPSPTPQVQARHIFPLILCWNKFFGRRRLDLKLKRDIKLSNSVPPCLVTYDRALLNVSDAVLFHCYDMDVRDMPSKRYPHQKWIFWCLEPPPMKLPRDYGPVASQFNWTMTYHKDSDVITRYGGFSRKKNPVALDFKSAWKQKSKTAVWVASNCRAHSRREDFVKELRKYIHVDVYGHCGALKCARGLRASCYRTFGKKYYFYLSLENSLCDEYVTEKLYYPLGLNVIPVVMGGADYAARAPPHSVINVASFRTPRHLAEYLKHVMTDYNLYKSYLEWKREFDVRVVENFDDSICPLCEKLHSPEFRTYSAYDNVKKWFANKSSCYKYNDSTWKAAQKAKLSAPSHYKRKP
ncbi:alpha-(1,3)-fucosyltransferase C-like [Ornithodoros turicata]|uniref:alpha-(1,3)-fucosyltransferase C-like n=1 Tax=Ornithodoros turicata TaxID=34597 RepID=UPI003138B1CE